VEEKLILNIANLDKTLPLHLEVQEHSNTEDYLFQITINIGKTVQMLVVDSSF